MHRVTPPWWFASDARSRATRVVLTPLAEAYAAGMNARRALYRHGWLRRARLPLPSVAVGNLAVGGAGKTPIAGWIAQWFWEREIRPGIVLRGYGGDEAAVHRGTVPDAVVVEDPDRHAGAWRAVEGGARVLVLDDAFQRRDVVRDLDIVLVAAESVTAPMRTLPAGPWRERWTALQDADLVVVTRKTACDDDVRRVVSRVRAHTAAPVATAHLRLGGFVGLRSGDRLDRTALAGARVTAGAGIAHPDRFGAQLAALGADVRLVSRPDHHAWRSADVADLLHAETKSDYVVVTAKDAVTLARAWPAEVPEPIVASLEVGWDSGADTVEEALVRLVRRATVANVSDTYRKGYAVGVSRSSL